MTLFFYIFASLTIISSILVVISKNPVYSMLWLIFAFCNSAGLMILLGAEFLSMMLIIVYVGAVAVLFLFIIMMLTTREDFIADSFTFTKNKLFYFFLSLFLILDFSLIISLALKSTVITERQTENITEDNVFAIGKVLYTDYILPFQTCGLILFTAMISSIYLTKRNRSGVKRQNINYQVSKTREESVQSLKIPSREGIKDIHYDD